MSSGSKFARLLDLAREPSSEKRRELLREVTDLFFDTQGNRSGTESILIGEVLQAVATEMQEGVLAELAERFADAPDAPLGLMRDLANHAFSVAEPVLQRSTVLTDEDLLRIVSDRSQDHIRAVAQRPEVSERVSDAIVTVGDDFALDALLRNDGARLSRSGMEQAVDRARSNQMLHESVVGRSDLPLDLLNEMYFLVEQRLRRQILERNQQVDPAALDAALRGARRRMEASALVSQEELREAQRDIAKAKAAGELTARLLIGLYRDKKPNHFLWGFAELTGVDFDTASTIINRQDIDALAMVCRAAGIERPLFVTIAVLACGGDRAMSRAEEFGRMYIAVPIEAAQRAMRFYRVRKNTGAAEAA